MRGCSGQKTSRSAMPRFAPDAVKGATNAALGYFSTNGSHTGTGVGVLTSVGVGVTVGVDVGV